MGRDGQSSTESLPLLPQPHRLSAEIVQATSPMNEEFFMIQLKVRQFVTDQQTLRRMQVPPVVLT
ncbi:MAG: hypothetical protein ACI9R3_004294 [Verrucomicrobiales bacterium]|jgi:hypothetical protein